MSFLQLKYFLTAAEERNISRAAQRLYVSQPALSFQIKNLEKEIGNLLFLRGAKTLTLTETGRFLYRRAKAILALLEETEDQLCVRHG